MKIAAVSTVKDECDIIELFVRINARVIDHFFIVDNGSSDTTSQILARLMAEDFPITISSDSSIDHPQQRIITRVARQIAEKGEYDRIFPLDADEFIQADKATLVAELAGIPAGCCARVNWATFIPTSELYFFSNNPLWLNFRQRVSEPRQYSKVIVPSVLAVYGAFTAGNHGFKRSNKKALTWHSLNILLAHVPVRSSDQLSSKAIIGSYKLSIKESRRSQEGLHWDIIANEIRDNNFVLSYSVLRRLALSYGADVNDGIDDLLPDTRIGTADDCIRYPELARINLVGRYDAFMRALCTEIQQYQKQNRKKFLFF